MHKVSLCQIGGGKYSSAFDVINYRIILHLFRWDSYGSINYKIHCAFHSCWVRLTTSKSSKLSAFSGNFYQAVFVFAIFHNIYCCDPWILTIKWYLESSCTKRTRAKSLKSYSSASKVLLSWILFRRYTELARIKVYHNFVHWPSSLYVFSAVH